MQFCAGAFARLDWMNESVPGSSVKASGFRIKWDKSWGNVPYYGWYDVRLLHKNARLPHG